MNEIQNIMVADDRVFLLKQIVPEALLLFGYPCQWQAYSQMNISGSNT